MTITSETNGAGISEIQILEEAEGPVRRSNRRRVGTSTAPNVAEANGTASTPPLHHSPVDKGKGKRNPKRKATEAGKSLANLPDNLLEEALAPLGTQDVDEWDGWVELESEPAFFNIMLRELGVQNVKAEEIFSIDQMSLDMLPKPVYGLIFLFQYSPMLEDSEDEEESSPVWFANQTTSNACATVALLNIIMNTEDLELGERLQTFKESTASLSTALRGYKLSTDTFIRKIHNSFTRRMDHLNVDLSLENEISDAEAKSAKKRSTGKKGKKVAKKKRKSEEYGFHFVAYVPAGGYVWQLDGLRSRPRRIGAFDTNDWTAVARPEIQTRMLQYEESQLSFNLLALCQSPLAEHARNIARFAASSQSIRVRMRGNLEFADLISAEGVAFDMKESQLAEFNLTMLDVENAEVAKDLSDKLSEPTLSATESYEMYRELTTETKAAIGEYRAEMISVAEDEQRVRGRKKDYGLALHNWVKKLAEKGVLEDIIKTT